MSMNRTWGGEHEIQVARELYSMEIAILDSNQLGKYGGSFTSKTSCKLLFSNGNHYDLLVVNESKSDKLENKFVDKNENHTDESQIPTPTSDIFPDSEHATAQKIDISTQSPQHHDRRNGDAVYDDEGKHRSLKTASLIQDISLKHCDPMIKQIFFDKNDHDDDDDNDDNDDDSSIPSLLSDTSSVTSENEIIDEITGSDKNDHDDDDDNDDNDDDSSIQSLLSDTSSLADDNEIIDEITEVDMLMREKELFKYKQNNLDGNDDDDDSSIPLLLSYKSSLADDNEIIDEITEIDMLMREKELFKLCV